jgi:hypothetical protein
VKNLLKDILTLRDEKIDQRPSDCPSTSKMLQHPAQRLFLEKAQRPKLPWECNQTFLPRSGCSRLVIAN